MRHFLIEFGMTPASRSRIHVSGDNGGTDDAFETFMRGIGAMEDRPNVDKIRDQAIADVQKDLKTRQDNAKTGFTDESNIANDKEMRRRGGRLRR
jgi:hypothetical protein